jgi:hypothetical protein
VIQYQDICAFQSDGQHKSIRFNGIIFGDRKGVEIKSIVRELSMLKVFKFVATMSILGILSVVTAEAQQIRSDNGGKFIRAKDPIAIESLIASYPQVGRCIQKVFTASRHQIQVAFQHKLIEILVPLARTDSVQARSIKFYYEGSGTIYIHSVDGQTCEYF